MPHFGQWHLCLSSLFVLLIAFLLEFRDYHNVPDAVEANKSAVRIFKKPLVLFLRVKYDIAVLVNDDAVKVAHWLLPGFGVPRRIHASKKQPVDTILASEFIEVIGSVQIPRLEASVGRVFKVVEIGIEIHPVG